MGGETERKAERDGDRGESEKEKGEKGRKQREGKEYGKGREVGKKEEGREKTIALETSYLIFFANGFLRYLIDASHVNEAPTAMAPLPWCDF